jgi:hypothetical protein
MMPVKSSTLLIVSLTPGSCKSCRHANQGTVDFAEHYIFCKWGGPPRQPEQSCDQQSPAMRVSGGPLLFNYYFYEAFDGTNCTWQIAGDYRILAEDAEPEMRIAMQADRPFIPSDSDQ